MRLREDHIPLWAMLHTPLADTPLQGAAHASAILILIDAAFSR
jgi:hypothetical protein